MYSNDIGLAIGMVVFMFLLYGAMMAVVIVNYILTAKAMYKLSQRREIPNPWMAWVPMLNSWNMGLVVNEYDLRLGMKRKWNMVLVILHGATVAAMMLTYIILFVVMMITGIQGDAVDFSQLILPIVIMYIFMIIMLAIMMTMQFIVYILLFKIFESTVPDKAVKYLILSLLVPLASAICLTKAADKGYPFPAEEPVYTEPTVTE